MSEALEERCAVCLGCAPGAGRRRLLPTLLCGVVLFAALDIPALAEGGTGGGADAVTGAGGNGSNVGRFLGGGGGGAGPTGGNGGSADGVAGGAGGTRSGQGGDSGQTEPSYGGGSGGGGGAHGYVGGVLPGTGATGGAGGNGGDGIGGGDGGGGGAGGWGAAIVASPGDLGVLNTGITGGAGGSGGNSSSFIGGGGGSGGTGLYLESSGAVTVGVNANVSGGAGGDGGDGGSVTGSPVPTGGDGGAGGAGIRIVGGATLTINSAVTGGDGGAAGNALRDGFAGVGGAGIVGSDLNVFVGSTGSVAGGLADGGAGARADAITFTGGTNTLSFGAGTTNLSGNIRVVGGSSLAFAQSGIDTIVGNVITGDGSVIKSGNAVITLTGDNVYTGGTTVSSGTLAGGAVDAFSAASAFTVQSGGVLDLGGFDQTIASLSGAGLVTNNGGADAVLTVGGGDSSTTFSGLLEDGTLKALGLTKVGTGTLTLSGDNLYSGRTTISAGTLEIADDGAGSPDSDYLVNTGATLEIADDIAAGIGSLADGPSGGGKVTIGATGDMTVLSVGETGATTTFSGRIGGTGSLEVVGGSLTLTGASAIGGDLTVGEDATVAIAGSSASFSTGMARLAGTGVLGRLNITGGAGFDSDLLFISGKMTADGIGTTVRVTDAPTFVGIANTAATLTISGGAVMESEGGAIIDSPIVAAGAIVTGAGSTWNVAYGLAVGNVMAGGTGLLTVSAGGAVNVIGDTVIAADTALTGLDASSVVVTGRNASLSTVGLEIGTYACACGDLPGELIVADGGIVKATGSVTIGALGILNIGNGGSAGSFVAPLIENDGTIVADFTDSAALGANISGMGSLTKSGPGTLVLHGQNSFTGGTTVEAGKLVVGQGGSGALGGSLLVKNGGVLGGTGTLGSAGSTVTIAAGGIHAPGNSIGSQTVLGDYVNHGTLQIEGTPGAADRVIVNGKVDIAGATLDLLLSPTTADAWAPGKGPLTLIDNRGADAVKGVFGAITGRPLFLSSTLDYAGGDGNDVTLMLERNGRSFASVGRTSNQIATATALDSLPADNRLWKAVSLTRDEDVARSAFDQLSGEIHASTATGLIEDSRQIRDAVNNRLRSAFEDVREGSFQIMAYGGGAQERAAPATESFAAWGSAFGSWSHADSDGNAAAFSRSIGGFVIGADGFVSEAWRLGVVAGYSHSSFKVDDRRSSASSDNYHIGLYGGARWGSVSLRSGIAYTRSDVDSSRTIAFPGFADAPSASYSADTTQLFGELGYGLQAGVVALEPFANLAYVNLQSDGFSGTGGPAALTVESSANDVTFTTLGLRASTDFAIGSYKTTARGMLGWQHAFGDTVPLTTQAFAGSSPFTIAGAPIAKDSLLIEAGFDFAVSPRATLGLSYNGQIASQGRNHGARADFILRF
ncbi:autotransporter domain-containing protein [Mesorhizobium sp. 1B3]|uniref:autotransporter domain-containing protein n=1 Tax=Mesorhizobium sp. 1B3 TaxID=3243599 RepID=UPI003D955D35